MQLNTKHIFQNAHHGILQHTTYTAYVMLKTALLRMPMSKFRTRLIIRMSVRNGNAQQ